MTSKYHHITSTLQLFSVIWCGVCLSATLQAKPRILIIGDSLTEGYEVAQESAFPAQLAGLMQSSGYPQAKVVNAGTSGATSAFGLRTLRFQVKFFKPDFLILALGANDGLRAIAPKQTYDNLAKTIALAHKHNIKVVLAGMEAPPNYGKQFPEKFRLVYTCLRQNHKLSHFIPFLLEGVAGQPQYNLPDGIHPNTAGYKIIATNIWNHMRPLIDAKNRPLDSKPPQDLSPRSTGYPCTPKPGPQSPTR